MQNLSTVGNRKKVNYLNFQQLQKYFANNLIEQAKVQFLKFSMGVKLSTVSLSGLLSFYYRKCVKAPTVQNSVSLTHNYPKDSQKCYGIQNKQLQRMLIN
jgi:hypothetical protein